MKIPAASDILALADMQNDHRVMIFPDRDIPVLEARIDDILKRLFSWHVPRNKLPVEGKGFGLSEAFILSGLPADVGDRLAGTCGDYTVVVSKYGLPNVFKGDRLIEHETATFQPKDQRQADIVALSVLGVTMSAVPLSSINNDRTALHREILDLVNPLYFLGLREKNYPDLVARRISRILLDIPQAWTKSILPPELLQATDDDLNLAVRLARMCRSSRNQNSPESRIRATAKPEILPVDLARSLLLDLWILSQMFTPNVPVSVQEAVDGGERLLASMNADPAMRAHLCVPGTKIGPVSLRPLLDGLSPAEAPASWSGWFGLQIAAHDNYRIRLCEQGNGAASRVLMREVISDLTGVDWDAFGAQTRFTMRPETIMEAVKNGEIDTQRHVAWLRENWPRQTCPSNEPTSP